MGRMRNLLLMGALIALPIPAFAQTVANCMQTTGLMHYGGHSAAVAAGSNIAWLFGGPGGGVVFCDPPTTDVATIGSGGSMGFVTYLVGVGGHFSTATLSPPDAPTESRAYIAIDLAFAFRVIPDDPFSTDPVTIDITTRHRFGANQQQTSGSAIAENSYQASYAVSPGPLQNPGFAPQWSTQGLPIVEDDYYDLVHTLEVPVNTDLVFKSHINHGSYAYGRTTSIEGSAASALSSSWTFEATTDEAAMIVFDFEDLLGLDPPQLDVVPEPALGSMLVPLSALFGGVASRARKAGGVPLRSCGRFRFIKTLTRPIFGQSASEPL